MAVLAATLAVPGLAPGSASPVLADCGQQAPPRAIGAYVGYAFDGVITGIEVHQERFAGWLYRMTMDVSQPLVGDVGEQVVFDLETGGDCAWLQGDRYKVGDRLLVTASAPPSVPGTGEPDVRWFERALTWRHEWADDWTLHGLLPADQRFLSRDIRRASAQDEILMLVAPDALPFAIDDAIWSVAAPAHARDALLDAVPWGDGFVALGHRTDPRGRRSTPAIWRSPDGHRWDLLPDALPPSLLDGAQPMDLVAFRDRLFLLGADGGTLVIWRSADGARWERVLAEPIRDDPPTADGRTLTPIGAITSAADDERLVVLAHNETLPDLADRRVVWTSTDGSVFSRSETTGLARSPVMMISTGDGFALPQDDGSIRVSTDGVTWVDGGSLPPGWVDLAADAADGTLIATVNDGMPGDHEAPRPGPIRAGVETSTDDGSWSRRIDGPGEAGWAGGIDAAGGRIAALGDLASTPWVLSSKDAGTTWMYSELPGADGDVCPLGVVVGTRSMVVIGGCGGPLAWVADR